MHIKGFQTPIQSENCHMNFNVTKSATDSGFILSHLHMKALQTLEGLASEMIPYMVLFILTWSSDSLCQVHYKLVKRVGTKNCPNPDHWLVGFLMEMN